MTDPVSLREGLAERLDAVPGLRAYAHVPGQLSPPAVVVGEWSCEYDETLGRGWDRWRFRARLVVAPTTDHSAERKLDSFFASSGVSSIKAALEADQTLGGRASTVRVARVGPAPQVVTLGQQEYIGCDIEIEVMARGT